MLWKTDGPIDGFAIILRLDEAASEGGNLPGIRQNLSGARQADRCEFGNRKVSKHSGAYLFRLPILYFRFCPRLEG